MLTAALRPNNSFKPNLLRYGDNMAEKACHVVASTAQVGLIQALPPLKNTSLLEMDLKDQDGSCRDINFSEQISHESALTLLDAIATEWSFRSATDTKGNSLSLTDMRDRFQASEGALSTFWTEGPLIRQLQCLLSWNTSDDVFCEITFFPDDIVQSEFTMPTFMALLAMFIQATQSTEYYVRYENASWRHGDTSATSSVIFSHNSHPLEGANNSFKPNPLRGSA